MTSLKDKEFVHLHVHTDHSLLDGCAKIDKLCERAKELGMKALSITDHGVLYGLASFYKKAHNYGIKPILGCEIYLIYDDKDGKDNEKRKTQKTYHMGLLAKNFKGYQNLCKLNSLAHTKGFYYRPRTDLNTLERYSEGLIGFSGCLAAVIPQFLKDGHFEEAKKATSKFIDIFGRENFIIELMDHGLAEQKKIIPDLIKIGNEFGLKIVATNDVHYVKKEDNEPHDSLLCIQTGTSKNRKDRMKYDSKEFYLKSREEMDLIFKEFPKSIINTSAVAEMCDVKLPFGENHYPVFQKDIKLEFNSEKKNFEKILEIYYKKKNEVLLRDNKKTVVLDKNEKQKLEHNGLYLFQLSKLGLKERFNIDYDKVRSNANPKKENSLICDRIDYELAIIIGTGFTDYFLIVWDFIKWARDKGIPVGPGRGSGAGCLISYILKITDINPLQFGLLFERMLNLERISPPDFDVDFCMRRRDEVVEYVRQKYGEDRVANIITYQNFGAKGIIRDLARVNDIEYKTADKLAKMIPDELNISIKDSIKKSKDIRDEINRNKVFNKIINEGNVIEGMIRNTGKHACGIIIADQTITNLVPVTIQEGDITTQYSKDPSEELGFLKMDFLGLKTLTVIHDTELNISKINKKEIFNIEKISFNDANTFDLLNSGKTTGVFQLESLGMQKLCRQIQLSSFEEIIALIALYRPGPMQFIPQFIKGKKDPKSIDIPHPLLKEIVRETYGVLVYQEQVMQAAQIIAGYTLGDADILRRAMGKKIKKVMDQQKQIFIDGAYKTNKIDKKNAESIFQLLEKFAEYGFNKSHSAAYAMLSYRTAYLKANFPVEFLSALLTSEEGNATKISSYLEECEAMKISVLSPDINTSRLHFTPIIEGKNNGSIRFGFSAIKGVGLTAAKIILAERENNGPYSDFYDFIKRIYDKNINKRIIENLIRTGSFDSFKIDRLQLIKFFDKSIKDAEEEAINGGGNVFNFIEYGKEVTIKNSNISPLQKSVKLEDEKELLGVYLSGHPLDEIKGLIHSIDSFHNEHELINIKDKMPFRICGVIDEIKTKLTRKSNKKMATFTLNKKKQNYEIVIFPETYTSYQKILEKGKLVIIQGTLQITDNELQLFAYEIFDLKKSLSQFIIKLNFILSINKDTESFIRNMREFIDNNHGSTKIGLNFIHKDNLVETQTAQSLSLSLSLENYSTLIKDPTVVGINAQTTPLKDFTSKQYSKY